MIVKSAGDDMRYMCSSLTRCLRDVSGDDLMPDSAVPEIAACETHPHNVPASRSLRPKPKVAALAVEAVPWTVGAGLLMSVVQVVWAWASYLAAKGSVTVLWTVTAPDGTTYPALECGVSG